MSFRTLALTACIAAAIVPSGAAAQSECMQSRASLFSMTPDLALTLGILDCPNAALDLRDAITSLGAVSDTLRLAPVFRVAALFRDDAVFRASLTLASNSATIEAARAWALYTSASLAQAGGSPPPPDDPTIANIDGKCRVLAVPDETAAGGSAIQPSTLLLAHSTAVALYRDASQSLRVRGLAFCLWRSIRRTVNPSPVAADMVLTYMCGNVFRVRNRGLVPVRLSWDVYGTTERGTVSVGASTLQGSARGVFNETRFGTARSGTARLFLGTQLVQTKANGGTVCTSP